MRVLVTGASTGLGLGAARALVAAGHDVVGHVRRDLPDGAAREGWSAVVRGDLSDLEQVRSVADQVSALEPLDAVIHNAGTTDPAHLLAVNVLAPYLLTALAARPARLVYLSSSMHRSGSTDLGRIARGEVTYSDSKLYVTVLAMAVAARWPGTVAHAVDPGWVPTRMGGPGAPDDLAAGHETQVWLATHEVTPATGGYWHHRRAQRAHPAAGDPAFQGRLIGEIEAATQVVLA